jgi:NAD(P)-dependent dehydrogenase (short-subunit alcohol dehydrogenase family)
MTPQKHNQAGSLNSSSSILAGKCAVVFGAGGSIGAAVAEEFATEGAIVFLAGRTKASLEAVAKKIAGEGGKAQVQLVDTLDEKAVDEFVGGLIKQTGKLDVVFNATGPLANEYGNGKHAVDLAVQEFMLAVTTIMKSNFITARAAARHMKPQRSGAIIFLTGSPARGHIEGGAAIGTAFGALECFAENLALELGPAGVRAVCLRTTANTDSRTIQETVEIMARMMNSTTDEMVGRIAGLNFLKAPASVKDTARAAAFLASDRARMFTGTVVNATAGAALD